uniref:ATP synthase complex subunit 8 n=1 Tax=Lachesilla anna TaxID=239245 RepID=A0A343QCG4_9NEOP|nr:ATP synthase F0 subunit 8 [Lachesilla anna]ATU07111.1 ATP synthase F0 subunit 8 [Lachesilla anna]
MPQMNPLLWLFLFITFILTFLTINPLIYFTKKFTFSPKMSSTSLKTFNWKW